MKILDLSVWLLFAPRLICVELIVFWKTVALRYYNNNSSTHNAGFENCTLSLFILFTILILEVTWWNFDCWLGPPGHPPRWLNCSNSWLHHQHWWVSYIELETLKDRYNPTSPCSMCREYKHWGHAYLGRIINIWDTNSLRLILSNCIIA